METPRRGRATDRYQSCLRPALRGWKPARPDFVRVGEKVSPTRLEGMETAEILELLLGEDCLRPALRGWKR